MPIRQVVSSTPPIQPRAARDPGRTSVPAASAEVKELLHVTRLHHTHRGDPAGHRIAAPGS
ncbi:hypothetical protein ACWDCB_02245 [Streptomyces sp. NPDC001178]